MKRIQFIIFSLLLLSCTQAFSQPITVFPGDCNNNGVVNNVDLLYIGIGFNETGPSRPFQGIQWNPVGYASQSWNQNTASGNNYGYIDCDGNGSIGNALDLLAVEQNYTLTSNTVTPDPYAVGAQGDPIIGFSVATDTIVAGNTLMLDIVVGTTFLPCDSLYGLAFSISYDTSLVDSIYGDFRSGWLATGGLALLQVIKNDPDSGRFDVGVTRFDGANVAGSGVIGSIGIAMDDNLKKAVTIEELDLTIERTVGMTRSETIMPLQTLDETIYILADRDKPLPASSIKVWPNPANDHLTIQAHSQWINSIELSSASGQISWSQSDLFKQQVDIPLSALAPGLYWARIQTDAGMLIKKVAILR